MCLRDALLVQSAKRTDTLLRTLAHRRKSYTARTVHEAVGST